MTNKALNDELRNSALEALNAYLAGKDEQTLRVASNQIAMLAVDSEGNEKTVVFTVQIPTGSRDGEPYDAFAMAEEYKMKCDEAAAKKAEAARKKAEKVERDRKEREAKAAARAAKKTEGK